jgi:Fe-S-cluster containining protein
MGKSRRCAGFPANTVQTVNDARQLPKEPRRTMPAAKIIPYMLDFGQGARCRLELPIPEEAVTAFHLLPAIFAVADAVHAQSVKTLETGGRTIGCGPGCSTCCSQLVPVSHYEAAYLAAVVRGMPTSRRSAVVARFTKATLALDEAGLLSTLTNQFTAGGTDRAVMTDLARRYWDLRIPCPFLENDLCSIHAHRPLACRQYMVTSRPGRCRAIYTADQDHELVIHPVDTGGALASFSGEGLDHSRIVPLIFSLLAERSILAAGRPALPGPLMMGRFLSLLTQCFSRAA